MVVISGQNLPILLLYLEMTFKIAFVCLKDWNQERNLSLHRNGRWHSNDRWALKLQRLTEFRWAAGAKVSTPTRAQTTPEPRKQGVHRECTVFSSVTPMLHAKEIKNPRNLEPSNPGPLLNLKVDILTHYRWEYNWAQHSWESVLQCLSGVCEMSIWKVSVKVKKKSCNSYIF